MKYYAIFHVSVRSHHLSNAKLLANVAKRLSEEEATVCTSLQDAILQAENLPYPSHEGWVTPIYEVNINDIKGYQMREQKFSDGKTINIFNMTPNQTDDFQILGAMLPQDTVKATLANKLDLSGHDLKNLKTQYAEHQAKLAAQKRKRDFYVGLGMILSAAITIIWFNACYPLTLALLAKAGLSFATAQLPYVHFGISTVVGLMGGILLDAACYKLNPFLTKETPPKAVGNPISDDIVKSIDHCKKALTKPKDKAFIKEFEYYLDFANTSESAKGVLLKYELSKLEEVSLIANDKERAAKEKDVLKQAYADVAADKFAI